MRKEIKELIDNGSIFYIFRSEKEIEIDNSVFIQCQETRKRTSVYKRTEIAIYANEKDYKEIFSYIRTLNMVPACGVRGCLFTNFLIRKEKLIEGSFPFKIEEKSIFANYFYRLVIIKNSIYLELFIDKTSAYLDDTTRLFFEL